jgi:hypothetical protein
MYTVNDVFSTALRPFSGTSRNSFASPNGIVSDAVRTASRTVDFIESKRVLPLEPALYTGDNLYHCPEDADTILDLYPAGGRSITEQAGFTKTDPLSIGNDYANQNVNFTTEWRNGMKLLRIQPGFINDTPILIHDCNSLTDDGTVTISGDGANLGVNSVFYLNGLGSIDFDIVPSGGSVTIDFTGITAKDIETITRDGVFTLGIFLPANLVGHITNVRLQIGTDSSNYYQMTSSTTAYGSSFIQGFNIMRFERRGAMEAGTVDDTAIDFAEVKIDHDLTQTAVGVKLDTLYAHKGLGYNLSYYSDYHFMNTAGAFLKIPTFFIKCLSSIVTVKLISLSLDLVIY